MLNSNSLLRPLLYTPHLFKVFVVTLVIVIQGCAFDKEWAENSRYPIILILQNNSQEKIIIKHIYSSNSAKGIFSLKGDHISPNENYQLRISEMTASDIIAGHYTVSGQCGSNYDWKKEGIQTPRNLSHPQEKISISIDAC